MVSEIFGTLVVIMAVAFLVETLVEGIFGRLMDHVPALKPHRWALVYVAVAVGILGAFIYQFDLIYLLARAMETPVQKTGFGITITGFGIGMGAAYIHQFISKFIPSKDQEDLPPVEPY